MHFIYYSLSAGRDEQWSEFNLIGRNKQHKIRTDFYRFRLCLLYSDGLFKSNQYRFLIFRLSILEPLHNARTIGKCLKLAQHTLSNPLLHNYAGYLLNELLRFIIITEIMFHNFLRQLLTSKWYLKHIGNVLWYSSFHSLSYYLHVNYSIISR